MPSELVKFEHSDLAVKSHKPLASEEKFVHLAATADELFALTESGRVMKYVPGATDPVTKTKRYAAWVAVTNYRKIPENVG